MNETNPDFEQAEQALLASEGTTATSHFIELERLGPGALFWGTDLRPCPQVRRNTRREPVADISANRPEFKAGR